MRGPPPGPTVSGERAPGGPSGPCPAMEPEHRHGLASSGSGTGPFREKHRTNTRKCPSESCRGRASASARPGRPGFPARPDSTGANPGPSPRCRRCRGAVRSAGASGRFQGSCWNQRRDRGNRADRHGAGREGIGSHRTLAPPERSIGAPGLPGVHVGINGMIVATAPAGTTPARTESAARRARHAPAWPTRSPRPFAAAGAVTDQIGLIRVPGTCFGK